MLQEFNAKNAQFRLLPQYKVKSEGEVVSDKIEKRYHSVHMKILLLIQYFGQRPLSRKNIQYFEQHNRVYYVSLMHKRLLKTHILADIEG